jgi:hypothetical protein
MPRRRKLTRSISEYPTRDEILAVNQTFKPGVIGLVRNWKADWKTAKGADDAHKAMLVQVLAHELSDLYNRAHPTVVLAERAFEEHGTYNATTNVITLSPPVSIITSLHEIAHHLFGHSERQATTWSVHLFKRVWPKAFARLEWRGHMLVKPTTMPKKSPKKPRAKRVPPKAIAPASDIVSFDVTPMAGGYDDYGNQVTCCCKCDKTITKGTNGVFIMAVSDKGEPIKGFLCLPCANAWATATKKYWDKVAKTLAKTKRQPPAEVAAAMRKLADAAAIEADEHDAKLIGEDEEEDIW